MREKTKSIAWEFLNIFLRSNLYRGSSWEKNASRRNKYRGRSEKTTEDPLPQNKPENQSSEVSSFR